MTTRILVPVDLDHLDKLDKALGVAARIAQNDGASVVYVGVIDPRPGAVHPTDGYEAQQHLDAFAAAQGRAHGIRTEEQIALRGDLHRHVGREIIAAADRAGCDLIVMASHLPGLKDHILTSNAGYVATHAPISVYVVR